MNKIRIHLAATIVATLLSACGGQDAIASPPSSRATTPAQPTPASEPTQEPTEAGSEGAKRIEITLTEKGFQPDPISVPRAKPVTLVFTRKTDKTCAKEVILHVGDKKIEKPLPLDQPVELAVTFPKAGKLRYACSMDMIAGVISVE